MRPVSMVPTESNRALELLRLTRRCRGIDKQISAAAKLSIDEMHCLSALFTEKPSSVRTLSDLINVAPTRASKILRDLEERSYLSRTIDVVDHRKEHVVLTEEGSRVAENLLALYSGVATKMLRGGQAEVALDVTQLLRALSQSD